jgi:hypothetical protein
MKSGPETGVIATGKLCLERGQLRRKGAEKTGDSSHDFSEFLP